MIGIFIVIAIIAIHYQLYIYIENLNKIHLFKNSLSNLEEIRCEYGIVVKENLNDIDHDIIEETNDFLRLRRNNLLLDFSQLKEKIGKTIQTRIDEIEGNISLPLYIALMATVLGIVISLSIFSLSEQNKANLLIHVAITMLATLTGVFFYFWQSKEFNQVITDFKNRLSKYWKIIENSFDLGSSNSFIQSIELLQKNLNHFNDRFEDTLINFNQGFVSTVGDLRDVINTNLKATQELNEVVSKIQQINLDKVIKGNYKVLEEIEFIVTKLQKFGVWFEKMENILLTADKMTLSLDQAIERTNNLELAVKNFNQATTFHTDIAKFLKEHLTKLEDYKRYAEETANKSFTQFKEQLQQTNAQLIENFKALEDNLSKIQKSFAQELAQQLHDTFSTTKIQEFQKQNDEFVKIYGKIVKDISERFEGLVEKTQINIDEIIKNFGRGSQEISDGFNNISEQIQNLQKSIKEFEEIEQISKNLTTINKNVASLSGNSDNGWSQKLEFLEHLKQLEKIQSIYKLLEEQKKDFEKWNSILSQFKVLQKQNQELIAENQKLIQNLTSKQTQTELPVSKTADLKVLEGSFTVSEEAKPPIEDNNESKTHEKIPASISPSHVNTKTQTRIQLGIFILLFLILLVLGFWAYKSIYPNTKTEKTTSEIPKNPTSTEFTFQAETQSQPDNFYAKVKVTQENIQKLYKNYKVEEIWSKDSLTLYKVYTATPKPEERYFTRLILMKNNEQIAEKLFYDLQLDFFIPREKDFLLGFNTPQEKVLKNCNCAKINFINWELEQFFEKTFKYKNYPFTYLKKLTLNDKGFEAQILNLNLSDNRNFDEYNAFFDAFGNIYKSFKKEIRN